MSRLDNLKQHTVVVADSGDIESIREFQPQDCTTNPSLILKAATMPQYQALFDEAIEWGKKQGKPQGSDDLEALICRRLALLFGCELLKSQAKRIMCACRSFQGLNVINYWITCSGIHIHH